MLLISNATLAQTQFNPSTESGNAWSGSAAQYWCATYYNSWPEGIEKNAILATSFAETDNYTYSSPHYGTIVYGPASLSEERFFFLSAKEADTLFSDDIDRKASGTGTWWWLRSPIANPSIDVGTVDPDGWLHKLEVISKHEARPAFNFDLSSVFFTSEISSESSTSYKMTLADSSRTVSVTSGKTLTRNSLTSVTVPYTVDAGSNHVSLLITN